MSMAATPPTITVIMPAFNEADRIARTIGSIARYRRAAGANLRHIVVADDGSTDATQMIAREAAASHGLEIELLSLPHRGKAWTIRAAMLDVARRHDTDVLMMLDADDELSIDQLDRVAWSHDPRTIYIGRRVGAVGGDAAATPPPIRRLMSLAMRTASRVLLGIRFPDTQCGFKLFPRSIVTDLFSQQRSAGWTFDAELLFIIDRVSHLPIVEVPVVWTPRGVSRVRPLAAALSGLAMFSTAWNRARRVYRPVGDPPINGAEPALLRR